MPINDLVKVESGNDGLSIADLLRNWRACGVIVVDARGKVTTVTPEAERILALVSPQRSGRSRQTLPAPLRSIIGDARKTGQAAAECRVRSRTTDKGFATLSITAILISGGNKTGDVIAILNDLSPAARLEQHLQGLDRLASIGTLSAGMAHEIKNALVAVRTFIDLLLEKNQDSELAGIVRREMGRVDSIVSQMLKFAAPAQPRFSSVRLHSILDHSLRLAQHRVGGKVISFQREFNATTDGLNGDDHQLEQAFVNLFLNAVEAIGSGGTVRIATELLAPGPARGGKRGPGRSLRVTITDSGGGIRAKDLQRIFDPFFTTKRNGTGLGLPVTRRIIEEHSGTIAAQSNPGAGTTFTVVLPAGAGRD